MSLTISAQLRVPRTPASPAGTEADSRWVGRGASRGGASVKGHSSQGGLASQGAPLIPPHPCHFSTVIRLFDFYSPREYDRDSPSSWFAVSCRLASWAEDCLVLPSPTLWGQHPPVKGLRRCERGNVLGPGSHFSTLGQYPRTSHLSLYCSWSHLSSTLFLFCFAF